MSKKKKRRIDHFLKHTPNYCPWCEIELGHKEVCPKCHIDYGKNRKEIDTASFVTQGAPLPKYAQLFKVVDKGSKIW